MSQKEHNRNWEGLCEINSNAICKESQCAECEGKESKSRTLVSQSPRPYSRRFSFVNLMCHKECVLVDNIVLLYRGTPEDFDEDSVYVKCYICNVDGDLLEAFKYPDNYSEAFSYVMNHLIHNHPQS